MATDEKPVEQAKVEVEAPNVGEPIREKSAGKWAVWFVIIVAIACVIAFLVK